ncbi:MAG TPA: hypothetical protein VMT62_02600 [Syntrophorhabdaceae bacterium]|nr:hypothetical protein [Syntrophorhabdaceae bacterium]
MTKTKPVTDYRWECWTVRKIGKLRITVNYGYLLGAGSVSLFRKGGPGITRAGGG